MTNSEEAARPQIPDYELLHVIGRGSYGDVWLARGVTGVFRAIKVVWQHRFPDRKPFDREFNGLREFASVSLGQTHHLAVVHVGINVSAGFFYYVMELADDIATGSIIDASRYVPSTLTQIRARRGRLPIDESVVISASLARGLACLHSRALVHRDIKPSNVIFVGGIAKLADIGLVTAVADAKTLVGTEGYFPPEGSGTPSADVYSLGKLIYEMMTGLDRGAFPRLPADLGEMRERKALLELNEIVLRACHISPAQRYNNAEAMLVDLARLGRGKSIRQANRWKSRVSLIRDLTIATLGLAVVAGIAVKWIQDREAPAVAFETPSEVERLLFRIQSLSNGVFTRDGIDMADQLAKRATQLAPDLARAWGARAYCGACQLLRGWDYSASRRQDIQTSANRALTIDRNEVSALLALSILLRIQGANEQSETMARRGLAVQPNDPRLWRALGNAVFAQGRREEALDLGRKALLRFPEDPMVHYDLALLHGRTDDSERLEAFIDSSLALNPIQAVLITKVGLIIDRKGDLEAARKTFETISPEDRLDDRVVATAMYLGLLERKPERVHSAGALTANSYITGYVFRAGPKAVWLALAYRQEGKHAQERLQWEEAIEVLMQRRSDNSAARTEQALLAVSWVYLGQFEKAAREIESFEAGYSDLHSTDKAVMLAVYYAALGDVDRTVLYLKESLNKWGGVTYHILRLHPWWDKLRGQTEFEDFVASAR